MIAGNRYVIKIVFMKTLMKFTFLYVLCVEIRMIGVVNNK